MMNRYSVLIVEDEFYLRQSIKKLVPWDSLGFEIIAEAEDGESAIELIEEKKPFLVMLDITLPRMSGMEVLDKLKFSSPNTNVIILSAHDNFEYAKRAIQYGVFEYLLKPVDVNSITASLSRLVEEKGSVVDIAHENKSFVHDLEPNRQTSAVEKVKIFIEQQYNNASLTLSAIAEHAIINENYLCKIFKQIAGISIFDYLIDFRLTKAKELFNNNKDLQTKQVALLVGYNDALYFSKSFKKKFKMSPSEYKSSIN